MKQLVLIICLIQFCSTHAQESYMQWLNGKNHSKGLYEFQRMEETTEVKKPGTLPRFKRVFIIDTFWFLNYGKDTITINKIHTADTSGITYSKKTAPNQKGFIAVNRLKVFYGSQLLVHENHYFNVMTNYSPWEFCTLDYVLVTPYYPIVIWNPKERSYAQKLDSFKSLKVYLDKDHFPICMGIEHSKSKEKLLTWKYWKNTTFIGDSIHLKKVSFYLSLVKNAKDIPIKIQVLKNQQWEKALLDCNGLNFEIYVDRYCDSIKVYNDSEFVVLPLGYQKLSEITYYNHLDLVKNGDGYYTNGFNVYPVRYIKNTYAIKLSNNCNLENTIIEMQTMFSEAEFSKFSENVIIVVLPDQNAILNSKLLESISQVPCVEYVSQMLWLKYQTKSFFVNEFYSTGSQIQDSEMKKYVEKCQFISDPEKSVFIYNKNILGENFLKDFNLLNQNERLKWIQPRVYLDATKNISPLD